MADLAEHAGRGHRLVRCLFRAAGSKSRSDSDQAGLATGLDSPLLPLDVSTVSTAEGTTLAYFGYKFEVPWKTITAVRTERIR